MKGMSRSCRAVSVGAAVALLAGCGVLPLSVSKGQDDMQPPIAAAGAVQQALSPAEGSGPFLYVGGLPLLMYALGSSKPLHVANESPSTIGYVRLALDLHGHLCEANGELSEAQLFEYDARNLKFVKGLGGIGAFPALVADHLGYLYASSGGAGIWVYAPGCTHRVNVIRRGASLVGPLVFDRSGNLYAGISPHYAVSVYAPTTRPGHMRFVRQIRDGISEPGPLAIGPSGDLFVANYNYSTRASYVTVYRPGGSTPVLTITKGMKAADAIAVDSTGWLYVATQDYEVRDHSGWISVYAPGGSQPVRKVLVHNPVALAIDPSDNLYVANALNHSTVLVYSPGATKLLQIIKVHALLSDGSLLIGSP